MTDAEVLRTRLVDAGAKTAYTHLVVWRDRGRRWSCGCGRFGRFPEEAVQHLAEVSFDAFLAVTDDTGLCRTCDGAGWIQTTRYEGRCAACDGGRIRPGSGSVLARYLVARDLDAVRNAMKEVGQA